MRWAYGYPGTPNEWEICYFNDGAAVHATMPSVCDENVDELLLSFFRTIGLLDWKKRVIAPRLARRKDGKDREVDKETYLEKMAALRHRPSRLHPSILSQSEREELWVIEDPFDLNHNLAGLMTPQCKERIRAALSHSYDKMNAELRGDRRSSA